MLTAGIILRRRLVRFAPWIHARPYSTPPVLRGASSHEIHVKVENGHDRHVNLAIRQPPRHEGNAPIILYLHRGFPQTSPSTLPTYELALGANAVTVRLDYTVSNEEAYPFPIHTILAGYDWIREFLLPPRYSKTSSGVSSQKPPKIGVCGELVGGSLATMLALTESHGEKRGAIRAAAVGNPIVDWTAVVDPDEDMLGGTTIGQTLKSKNKSLSSNQDTRIIGNNSDPSRNALLSLRAQYFRKPEKYFDAFASPLLFFRTPRYAVPGPVTVDPAEAEYASPSGEEPEPELIKKRLSHRNYPPTGSDVVLPRMLLELGEESVLKEQGMEMAELWRRSQSKRRESQVPGVENKIDVVIREGSGLWGEREMLEVGRWFGEVLRSE